MANTIEEFLVAVGYELDSDSKKELDKFSKGIEKFTGNLVKMGAALVAGGVAVTAFVSKVSSDLDKLGKSSETINTAVENVDALGFALNIATGNSDSMVGSLQRLTRTASEAARGVGGGVEAFGMLGVSSTDGQGQVKDTMELLMETADAISELDDPSRQLELADKLGLGDMILLLRQGSQGIRDLVQEGQELALVTQEDTKRAATFMDSTFRVLGRIMKGLSVIFTSAISPMMAEMVDGLKQWFLLNKEIISQDIKSLAVAIGEAFKFFANVVVFLVKATAQLVDVLGGVKNVLLGITTILGVIFAYSLGGLVTMLGSLMTWLTAKMVAMGMASAASFAAAQVSMLAVGVVLLLIIGLVDELVTMFTGGKTVIGEFFELMYDRFPAFEAAMQALADTMWAVWEVVQATVSLLTDPLNPDSWKKFFDSLKDILTRWVDNIIEELNKLPGINIGNTDADLGDLSGQAPVQQVAKVLDVVASPGGIAKSAIQNPGTFFKAMFSSLSPSESTAVRLGTPLDELSGIRAAVENQTINVTVSGTGVQEVEQAVMKAVGEANEEALRNLKTRIKK